MTELISPTEDQPLLSILQLTPLADDAIPFVQFLMELKDHPERADTAYGMIFRSVMEMGAENPEEETNPERRLYLQMLKERGIPSLKAFLHATGTQRFTAGLLGFWATGAANGAQLKQAVVVEGGPGSGKDFWGDGIVRSLEAHAKAWSVKGCPDHENPINLLKLLSEEQQQELLQITGINPDAFKIMMATALDPCQHCYNAVMGTIDAPQKAPNLSTIQVEALRISRRVAGISEWKPGQDCSLVNAFRQANRGFIRLPDGFIKRDNEPGKTDERLVLLDTTQYRRLPGATSKCGSTVTSASPLDVFTLITTNSGALQTFLDGLEDKQAFTRRTVIARFPYPTARVEEVRAYDREMDGFKKPVYFDPLVKKIIATVAVWSRMEPLVTEEFQLHPADRMRLTDGEIYIPKPISKSEWAKIWDGTSSSYSSSSSSSWGSNTYDSRSSSPSKKSSGSEDTPKISVPADTQPSIDLLWKLESPKQGLHGLDVPFMLGILSSINSWALINVPEKYVSALDAIWYLRMSIGRKLLGSNLTDERRQVMERCQRWLGGKLSNEAMQAKNGGGAMAFGLSGEGEAGLVESEYRRLLKNQLLRVFAPDYEQRAQQMYNDYKLHAQASFLGEEFVKQPGLGKVQIDNGLIDEIDCYRLGKPWRKKNSFGKDPGLDDNDKKFRGSLEVLISDQRDAFIEEYGRDRAKEFKESWLTIPELADAIRKRLDDGIGELIEKVMSTEIETDLTEDEQNRLKVAQEELSKLGYREPGLKPVLEYAKRAKVWSHKG